MNLIILYLREVIFDPLMTRGSCPAKCPRLGSNQSSSAGSGAVAVKTKQKNTHLIIELEHSVCAIKV